MASNPVYPGDEWMPLVGEEVYSPAYANYGIIRHVNPTRSAILDFGAEWHEVKWTEFHRSRRAELDRKDSAYG